MDIKVAKFGGSSVADGIQLRKIKDIIEADSDRKYIVVSAPGKRYDGDNKITDLLYLCGTHMEHNLPYDQLLQVVTDRFMAVKVNLGVDVDIDGEFAVIRENMRKGCSADYLASRGEYLNALLVAAFLGYDFVDTAGLIKFDGKGRLLLEETDEALRAELASHERAVIPGFYGTNAETGRVRTFSRGGSDITGALVARAVKADIYENWTDVSGFLKADPRIVAGAKPISRISYKELRELSYMGASVLHEDAIYPAKLANIPINIRNTNRPEDRGTIISAEMPRIPRKYKVAGIAGKKGFSAVLVETPSMNEEVGFGAHLLEIFARHNVSFEHLPTGIDTMSVVVHKDEFDKARNEILDDISNELNPESLYVEDGLALVAVVGMGMAYSRGTAARITRALADSRVNIKMIDQGSTEINMIFGVDEADYEVAINSIYNAIFE